MTNQLFLDKLEHYYSCNIVIKCLIYPFSEVINGHENKTMIIWGFRNINGSNNIHSPQKKWSGCWQDMKWRFCCVDLIHMNLTFFTDWYHRCPVIIRSKYLSSHICPLACIPHISSRISVIICFASSLSTPNEHHIMVSFINNFTT